MAIFCGSGEQSFGNGKRRKYPDLETFAVSDLKKLVKLGDYIYILPFLLGGRIFRGILLVNFGGCRVQNERLFF